MREALDAHGGLLVEHDGQAGRRTAPRAPRAAARPAPGRRARHACGASASPPRWRRRAEEIAAARKFGGLEIEARVELPKTVEFWRKLGYVESGRNGNRLNMLKMLPITRVAAHRRGHPRLRRVAGHAAARTATS